MYFLGKDGTFGIYTKIIDGHVNFALPLPAEFNLEFLLANVFCL